MHESVPEIVLGTEYTTLKFKKRKNPTNLLNPMAASRTLEM